MLRLASVYLRRNCGTLLRSHQSQLQLRPPSLYGRCWGARKGCAMRPCHVSLHMSMAVVRVTKHKTMFPRLHRPLSSVCQRLTSRLICKEGILSTSWIRCVSTASSAVGSFHEHHLDAVLKVYTTSSSPNYTLPWQNKPQKEVTGSGFVLENRQIMTNAHVVCDHKWVQVRRHGSPMKYSANVVAINHECDLALLNVDDAEFWEGLPSLELGEVPKLQDEVVVAGYPTGGDNLCVTRGIVSRVEPQQYAHGASQLLAAQIDAAINPGNSGGPALLDGKVAGVAFQACTSSENVGFVIPAPIMKHFLDEVHSRPSQNSFCSLGILCQATENQQLRSFLRMKPEHSGVLVNRVRPVSSANGHIIPNDLLMEIDGHSIANDGTIGWRGRERITFDYLISLKHAGDFCDLKILRDGEEISVNVELFPEEQITPVHQYDVSSPEYYILAGLVFTPLVQPYLHEWGDDWYNRSPRKLVDLAMNAWLDFPGQQIVILSQVLSHSINVGYSNMLNLRVRRVGGIDVKNLAHMAELIELAQKKGQQFVRIELDENRVIAFDIKEAALALPEILQQHRVPADRSLDLLPSTEVSETVVESDSARAVSTPLASNPPLN